VRCFSYELNSVSRLPGMFYWMCLTLLFLMHPKTATAATAEHGQTFDAPGGKLYYEVIGGGVGKPILVVNGGPGFDHTYLHLSSAWDALSQNRRVVFYDQRGNGRSAPLKPGQSCTLADQIDDLEALRAHLGLEKFDLVGHSWGGFLSIAYAARHPEHIAHLALVDSAAPKWSDTIFLFDQVFPETTERQAAVAFANELGDKAASDVSIREYVTMLFYSPEKRDSFVAQLSANVYNKDVNAKVEADLARFDLHPELRKFRFPTLVVTGRHDMNVAPLVAYRIHRDISGSTFAVFERSGHLPFYEEPDLFVRVVHEFLQDK